jgi:hypothetical protein
MKFYRSRIIIFIFTVLVILPFAVFAQIPKAHRHEGKLDSMLAEIKKDFSIVETRLEKDAALENTVKNKNRTFEAFTVAGARIFVKDLKSGKIFELKGLPFEWRDFSDLVWSDNQTLMFDRWVQPHYGNHYAVNIVKRKLIEAAPFPDESMLKKPSEKP